MKDAGFFDIYGDQCKIIVTGSARLDVYKKGGDSLLGRYFLYRMHPQSVAEILEPVLFETEIRKPGSMPQDKLDTLLQYSGFPEPYLANNRRFYNRLQRLRLDLLFREELRDLTRIQEVGQVQVLAKILQYQDSQSVNYSNLANEINVSVDTVCRWIATLESLYYCFSVRPWFLVEVKTSGKQSLNKNLFYFQEKTGTQHAFQVDFDLEFIAQDCFSVKKPVIVSATTFLSQLV
jgi:predicted AAA+ superfamily ATPase